MKEKSTKIRGSGQLKILDIELDCYVLEDGETLVTVSSLSKSLDRPLRGSRREDTPALIDANNLQPFIRPELRQKLLPKEYDYGNKKVLLYDADIIPMICEVYLEARDADVLSGKQLAVAKKFEILMRAFARVGIRALIYEQLGFERFKHPDAFRMLIESYLSEEIRKRSKQFPDELFIQMDRIYGNQPMTSGKRPQYYAKFIRKYIYDPIEGGHVLHALDERNPVVGKGRKHKHHTVLNEEKGLNALKAQIWQIIGVLKSSPNKRRFEENYKRVMGQITHDPLFDID